MSPRAAGYSRNGWLETHERGLLGSLAGFYALGFGALAYGNPLTSDEIFSFYIARITPISRLWTALSQGADTHPPLHYLILRFAHQLFGPSALAGRLPFLAVGFMASLALYAWVKERLGSLYGLVAMAFFLGTSNALAGIQTRPYALLEFFYLLVLHGWRRSTSPEKRTSGLFGIGLSMMLAIFTHFYGGLLALPVVVGEIWRSYKRRRFQAGVWIALALGTLPIIFLTPQIRHAGTISQAEHRHSNAVTSPTPMKLLATYTTALQPALGISVGLGLLLLLLCGISRRSTQNASERAQGFPAEELASAVSLVLIPLLLYGLGVFLTGAYGTSYGFMASLGLSMLLAQGLFRTSQIRSTSISALPLGLFLTFAGQQTLLARHWIPHSWNRYQVNSVLQGNECAGPRLIVITHSIPFLQLLQEAPPDLRSRLRYLADVERAERYGDPSPDLALVQLRPWADIPVLNYSGFVKDHPSFLIYDWGLTDSWLIPALRNEGASLEVLGTSSSHKLLSVTWRLRA